MSKKKKKKKGKKKGGKKKTKKENPLILEILSKYSPEDIKKELIDYSDKLVKIKLHLLNWEHMDFTLILSERTPLFIVEQKIKERHGGSIEKISLYKDNVQPGNLLTTMTHDLSTIFEFSKGQYKYVEPLKLSNDLNVLEKKKEDFVDELEEKNKKKKKKEEIGYEVTMYYDFEHFSNSCPLLNTSPKLVNVLDQDELKKKHIKKKLNMLKEKEKKLKAQNLKKNVN